MTISYGPFATGAGASFGEDSWSSLLGAACPDGVIDHANSLIALNKLAVSADNTILGVHVASGRAAVRGHWFQSDASTDVNVAAADATNPRLDWVVLQLDRSAHTIAFTSVTGTPAGSPVAPSLTRSAGVWQVPLAQVRVEAATSVIASSKVTDARLWARSFNRVSATGVATMTGISTTVTDVTDMTVTMWTDGGNVRVDFSGIAYNATAGQWVSAYVQVDGGANNLIGQNISSGSNETGSISGSYDAGALAAGLHTFKIRTNVSGGTGNIVQQRTMIVSEIR